MEQKELIEKINTLKKEKNAVSILLLLGKNLPR